jgi:hypothetical protein
VILHTFIFVFERLQNLEPYFFVTGLSPNAPNFEETPMVAIKQGATAEAAISGVIETIDSMINYSPFLIAK